MKLKTLARIETAILIELEDVVSGSFTVCVHNVKDYCGTDDKVTVSFSNTYNGTGKTKKLAKKLVGALYDLAEEEGLAPESVTKDSMVFYEDDLKALFPKSGRLSAATRLSIESAISNLWDIDSALYDAQFNNAKVAKVMEKVDNLRNKLDELL